MNTLTLTIASVIASAGLAATAWAASDQKVTFEQLDSNADGFVERSDIPADHELARLFNNYDMDGDDRLSMVEFRSYTGESETEEADE